MKSQWNRSHILEMVTRGLVSKICRACGSGRGRDPNEIEIDLKIIHPFISTWKRGIDYQPRQHDSKVFESCYNHVGTQY